MKKLLVILGTLALLGYAVVVGLERRPPPPDKAKAKAPPAIALTKTSVVLPPDSATLPAGPNVEVVTASCTSCHSAAMITTQAALKPDQWAATVKKMREVYKAPIAEADVPKILAYLEARRVDPAR